MFKVATLRRRLRVRQSNVQVEAHEAVSPRYMRAQRDEGGGRDEASLCAVFRLSAGRKRSADSALMVAPEDDYSVL